MYKRILVGWDGSKQSIKALETAVRLAERDGSDLFVFHAIRHHYHLPFITIAPTISYMAPYYYYSGDSQLHESLIAAGSDLLDEAKRRVHEMGLDLHGDLDFHLETDLPPAEYAEYFAREMDVDLIVVGCKGHHSRTRSALIGTVAGKLLNDAPCQVLIVG
ncbi:MAG TPA: universal stress protein [Candidatus Lokiarchaeia archaeon]|nr:universal stress protein [Candidatus Lokiarchaeia archaeon]